MNRLKDYWLTPIERFRCTVREPGTGEPLDVYLIQTRMEIWASGLLRFLGCCIGFATGSAIGTLAAKILLSKLQ